MEEKEEEEEEREEEEGEEGEGRRGGRGGGEGRGGRRRRRLSSDHFQEVTYALRLGTLVSFFLHINTVEIKHIIILLYHSLVNVCQLPNRQMEYSCKTFYSVIP